MKDWRPPAIAGVVWQQTVFGCFVPVIPYLLLHKEKSTFEVESAECYARRSKRILATLDLWRRLYHDNDPFGERPQLRVLGSDE